MPKHLLEDMVKIQHQRKEPRKIIKEPKENEIKEIQERKKIGMNHNKNKSRYMLWFVALVSVAFCFFAFSFLFSKAEIRVDPKIKDVVLNENLSASKDSNADGLSFDMMVIPDEESAIVKASGEKDVAIKAMGTVCIFNKFSSSSQKLSIDTRLEGSNGKIYKTQKEITVPGMNKSSTPVCPIEVGIYATEAGQEYNSSSPLDFSIFGFKGTSKYSKFIIRSKPGTEITGGFVGKAPDISDADKATVILSLKNSIQEKLLQKATDHPSTVVLFKDAVFTNIDDSNVSLVLNKDSSATLTLKGTLYGFLFDEQKLTKKIAENNIDKYDGSEIYIPNIRDLTFSLSNKNNISFDNVKNIDFNLSGPAKIIWKLDVNKFTTDLLGKSKKGFNLLLSQYSNIDSATLTLSPFWKMSIPDKTKDIKIIVNYPK